MTSVDNFSVCLYVCHGTSVRPDSRFLHTRSLPISCILIVFCTSDKKKLHKMNPDNESKQERLRIRRDRERQARAQETAEEKEVRLAKRREKHRALKFKVTIALDANRASQQLRRDTETPEARQARLQQMAASTQTSRASGKYRWRTGDISQCNFHYRYS